jgi:hypothetical protein
LLAGVVIAAMTATIMGYYATSARGEEEHLIFESIRAEGLYLPTKPY